jgi:hypothetical protein
MPVVLNAKDVGTHVENSVYCGRPSKFGNPFKIDVNTSRSEVIRLHREWFLKNTELIRLAKIELKGKNLICWCAPKSCHCDIILEVANESDVMSFFI